MIPKYSNTAKHLVADYPRMSPKNMLSLNRAGTRNYGRKNMLRTMDSASAKHDSNEDLKAKAAANAMLWCSPFEEDLKEFCATWFVSTSIKRQIESLWFSDSLALLHCCLAVSFLYCLSCFHASFCACWQVSETTSISIHSTYSNDLSTQTAFYTNNVKELCIQTSVSIKF